MTLTTAIRNAPLARVLTKDKTIRSRPLNRLGIQVFRAATARLLYLARPYPVDPQVAGTISDLHRDGMAMVPDFLPAETFARLRDECFRVFEERKDIVSPRHHGTSCYDLVVLRGNRELVPAAAALIDDPRLRLAIGAAEKRRFPDLFQEHCAVERLTWGADPEGDPETQMHSDIFFHTHKAWLYLTDVTAEEGPLAYVKGSHRLRTEQLRRIYQESCRENQGSRRITPEEVAALGLEETPVICPANTLVLADVFGFHRRRKGLPGRTRWGIQVSVRNNPFAWWH